MGATDLAEMRKMPSTLGVHTQALLSFNMSKLPPIWLPPGFKYSKMSKFDGVTNPHSHIMRFQMESTPYCHDLGLLIHLFFYSLEGEPMEWFMSLSKEELSSFEWIWESFLFKYQHKIDPKPTFLDLAKEMMKPDEDWFSYANSWRDMASRLNYPRKTNDPKANSKHHRTNEERTC